MSIKAGENVEGVVLFYNEIYPAAQKAAEPALHNTQQAKGKNYPKVELKHYPGVTCPKCLQFYSLCRCG